MSGYILRNFLHYVGLIVNDKAPKSISLDEHQNQLLAPLKLFVAKARPELSDQFEAFV